MLYKTDSKPVIVTAAVVWEGRSFGSTNDQNNDNKLISVKDPIRHTQLRKPWNQAFKGVPLKSYEETLIEEINLFTSLLEKRCQASPDRKSQVDLAKWISYMS